MTAKTPLNRAVATSIYTRQEWTILKFHQTEVVKFDDASIILDSGGYQTVTTLRRMNQAANLWRLNFHVYQRDFIWWVQFLPYGSEAPIPFYDGIRLSRDRSQPYPEEWVKPDGAPDPEYNGWPNRATWNTVLWLDNEERYYRAYVAQARREAFTPSSAQRFVTRLFGYSRNPWGAMTPDGDPLKKVHWPSIAQMMNQAREA